RTDSNNKNFDDSANSLDNNNSDNPDKEYNPIARSSNFLNKQKEVDKKGAKINKEKQKKVSKKEAKIDKVKQRKIVDKYQLTFKKNYLLVSINPCLILEEETSKVSSHQKSNISAFDINYQDPNADDTEIIETLANTEIFLQYILEPKELEDQKKE
ncbi:13627_t:CDS:2, partial [Racocetra persica]